MTQKEKIALFEGQSGQKWNPQTTGVWLENLPGVTVLPELPLATYVVLENLPRITSLPEMPMATDVWLEGLPMVFIKTLPGDNFYKYNSAVFMWRGELHVKMGCFIRTVREWKADFWNNPMFPDDGSDKSNGRLKRFNELLEAAAGNENKHKGGLEK